METFDKHGTQYFLVMPLMNAIHTPEKLKQDACEYRKNQGTIQATQYE